MVLIFLGTTILLASNAVLALNQKPRAIQYSNTTSATVFDLSISPSYSSSSPSYAVPASAISSSQSSSTHSYIPSGLVTAPAPASSQFSTIASTTSTNYTTQSPPSTTASLNNTLAFCCAQLYQPGIGLVAWYTGPQIYATVATIVSVYAQYNNTKVLESVYTVNSTNATAYYGSYGVVEQFGTTTTAAIPGLPNTLVPKKDVLYGATVIGTQTEIVFPNQSLTITSPTPFWLYSTIPFLTGASTAGHNDTVCTLVPTRVPDAVGTGTSTAYVTIASSDLFTDANFNLEGPFAFPYDGNVSHWLSEADSDGVYSDAVGDVDIKTPDLINELADIPFVVSQFPQIASCMPLTYGEGAPTVHVPVSELTATSESVVTRTGIYSGLLITSVKTEVPQVLETAGLLNSNFEASSVEVLQTVSGLTTTAEPGTSTVEVLGTGAATSSGSTPSVSATVALTAEILGTAGSLDTTTYSDSQLSIDMVSPSTVPGSDTVRVSAQSAQVLESGASLGPYEYTGLYTSASPSTSAVSIMTTTDQSTPTTSPLNSEAPSVEILQTGSGLSTAAGTTASFNAPIQSGGTSYSAEPSATVLPSTSILNTASGSVASVTATAELLGTAGALDTTATDTASISVILPSDFIASSAEVLGTAAALGSEASPTVQGNTQSSNTPKAQAPNSVGPSESPAQANGPTSGESPATQAQPSWVSTISVQPAGSGQTSEGSGSAGAVGASVPAPVVIIGSATVTQNPASQYVVPASVAGGESDQTLAPGGSVVIDASGNTYSVPSAGTAIVVNGQTSAIVTPAGAVVTIGSGSVGGTNSAGAGILATPVGSSGEYVISGQTLSPGGSAVVASGATYSLPSAGAGSSGAVVINGATSVLPTVTAPPAAETTAASFGGVAATPIGSSGEYVIAGQTVSPGGPAVIASGVTYSLAGASAGSSGAVVINGVTSALPTVATSIGSSAVIFGGVAATPIGSSGGYVIAGQTVSPGGSAIIASGITYSLVSGSTGSPGAIVINGATSQIPAAAGTAANPALAGASTTAIPEYVIGGSTLVPGSPALTVSGSTISLDVGGSSVYINGQASAISTNSGSSPATNIISIAGIAATPTSGSAYLISGQTLLPGGSALTVSGTTYSLPPSSHGSSGSGSAIVINGVTTSLPQNGANSGASVITIASSTYAISQVVVSGTTEVVIGGSQTLAPGSVVTIAGGSVLSLASGGSGILVGAGTVSGTAASSGDIRSSSSTTAAGGGSSTTGNVVLGTSSTSTKRSSGAAAAAIAVPGGFAENGSTGGSIVGLLFAVAAWIMI